MNRSTQYDQQTEPKHYKSEIEEMYSRKPIKLIIAASISENKYQNTGCHA